MNIQAKKVEIIEQVIKIQDEHLLQAIRNLIAFGMQYGEPASEVDFWEELTEASISQLDDGNGIAHENVIAEFRQKYFQTE